MDQIELIARAICQTTWYRTRPGAAGKGQEDFDEDLGQLVDEYWQSHIDAAQAVLEVINDARNNVVEAERECREYLENDARKPIAPIAINKSNDPRDKVVEAARTYLDDALNNLND